VQDAIPIFWGGASDLAIELGAQCADVYAVGPGTLAQTDALVSRFKGEAARYGRNPGISMSMRVILGDSEEAAWDKAASILETVTGIQAGGTLIGRDKGEGDPGTQDALALAAQGARVDERLWTGITQATKGRLHATALVGTARQVADALLAYYDIGVDRFLLNGFYTIEDATLFGKKLIPMIRAGVADRDARA
jgi:alkanesulfonate monooxygenase